MLAANIPPASMDVNADGRVSIVDALQVINAVSTAVVAGRHDVNSDGQVTVRDALNILNHLGADPASKGPTAARDRAGARPRADPAMHTGRAAPAGSVPRRRGGGHG